MGGSGQRIVGAMYHSPMPKTIEPATLQFRDGVPYSAAYGDVYHSADGGVGQARHVFLQGCGLPAAWAGRTVFSVLETGFGTGLNFLATWAAWRADPVRCARLHFCSVEKHPFSADDLVRLHAQWPEFAELAAELATNWPPPLPGFHRIALDGGRVQLTLMLGDAVDCLPQLAARIDAFYLDGFAPDRNADLWQPALYAQFARLARPGAAAATYTVAAPVRQGSVATLSGMPDMARHPGFAVASGLLLQAIDPAPVYAMPQAAAAALTEAHMGYVRRVGRWLAEAL